MKKFLIFLTLILVACGRRSYTRPALDGEDVYMGDSITNFCASYTQGLNRAIPGNTSGDLRDLIVHYAKVDGQARYHFLIGINDILKGEDSDYLLNMNRIFELLKGREIIVTSILPTMDPAINLKVVAMNDALSRLVDIHGLVYVDRYNEFTDANGLLDAYYAADDVHLNLKGCALLFN